MPKWSKSSNKVGDPKRMLMKNSKKFRQICRLLNGSKSAQSLHHVPETVETGRLVILVQVMRCPRNTGQEFATLKDNDGIQKPLCIKAPAVSARPNPIP